MRVEYRKFFSNALNQHFEFKAYGHSGKPLIVFPCSNGRYFDYENRNMLDILAPFINSGELRVFAVDSRDFIGWYNRKRDQSMGLGQRAYEDCINREFVPYICHAFGVHEKLITTGNSWGGYHALNFFLKFPWIYDGAVCLSGNYSLRDIIGRYFDQSVYFNDPLMYLPGLNDQNILRRLQSHYAVICHGTGAWESANHEASAAAGLLKSKGIPCWYDVWGNNYPHDWNSWQVQIKKYMEHFRSGVLMPGGMRKLIGHGRQMNYLEI